MLDIGQSAHRIATLKASSEKPLKVRLALGGYARLLGVGQQTEASLLDAHKLLVESNMSTCCVTR
ncbi:hypothetical protein A6V36_18210 [Paraburkholderia ginsengiterrae]|uniref:Uncharacterized protein n=1 Tax=Paraburkholderia ginsengiterrae TaxID=1462993 RepID=A0ABX2V4M6_9BURK|nr:hypothetical protein A6V36_18210 [Paraburkholderia ginsengiterrae]